MVKFTLPTATVAWLCVVVVLAEIDAVLKAVIAIWNMIKQIKARKKAKLGYVKITGDKYANGSTVPKWVKSALCIVGKIEGDRALICAPLGWVNINDFKEAPNGTDKNE